MSDPATLTMETGIKWSMSMNGTMEWFIWRVAMTREVSWRDASLPLVDLWEVKHTRGWWIVGCGCSMLWYCKSACRGETFSNHGSRLCDLDSIHAFGSLNWHENISDCRRHSQAVYIAFAALAMSRPQLKTVWPLWKLVQEMKPLNAFEILWDWNAEMLSMIEHS